jgi:4-amino-4-deoxy-L-arabinose transferase-like glycosyltransferase
MPFEKDYVIILLLSLIIFTLGLLITPGLSPDSTRYIAVAEKIITNGPWYPLTLHTDPLESWATSVIPPLFEYLIAGFLFLGFEKLTAGGLVSLLFLAFLPFPLFYLAKEAGTRNIGYLSVLFFFAMASTWYIGTWVWTETAFIFFSVSALFFCIKFLKLNTPGYLILCAFFSTLSCLTRWIGIVLVLSIVAVLFYRYRTSHQVSATLLLSYILLSLSPVSVLLVRNFIVKGTVYPSFGSRGNFFDIFLYPVSTLVKDFVFPLVYILPELTNVSRIGRHIYYNNDAGTSFITFNLDFFDGFYALFLLVMVIALVLAMYCIVKFLTNFPFIKERLSDEKTIFIVPVLVYTVLYLFSLMVLKSVSHFDDLDTRLLIPLYPLLLILFFYGYYEMVPSLHATKKAQIQRFFFLFVVLFLVIQGVSSSALLVQQREGKQFSSEEGKMFTTSQSFIFLENHWNKSDPIFTNVRVYPMKYYLDSYFNEHIYEIQGNFQPVPSDGQSPGNVTEILTSDARIILFIQTNKQDTLMEQIVKKNEVGTTFIRCQKDENYELWVNTGFDNFCR